MTADDIRDDPTLRMLRHAAAHDAAPARTDRIRQRCHGALARRAGAKAMAPWPAGAGLRRLVEPALVASVCVVYLTEVVRRALQLYGM